MSKLTKDWGANFFWVLIGAVIGAFIINPLAVTFFEALKPKPNLDITLITTSPIYDLNFLNDKSIKNFSIFYLKGPENFLYFADDKNFNIDFGLTGISGFCNCTYYGFAFKNNGDRIGSIKLILSTSYDLEISKPNKHLINHKCEGILSFKGCYFEMKDILKGEKEILGLKLNSSFNDVKIECNINDQFYCKINPINVFVASIDTDPRMIIDETLVRFYDVPNRSQNFALFKANLETYQWEFINYIEYAI